MPVTFTRHVAIDEAIAWELSHSTLQLELLDRAAADRQCPREIRDSAWTGVVRVEHGQFVVTLTEGEHEEPLATTCRDPKPEQVEDDDSRCECELPGWFSSGVSGILVRMENGRLAPDANVERCDACERYPSDAAALQKLIELGLTDAR